jgi:histone H1/5
MWEADGRPDGQSDHYWHKASQAPDESAKAKVKATAAKAAAALKGGNPAETKPSKVSKATAAKPKAAAAAKVAAPAVKAKPAAKAKAKKKD